MTQYIEFSFINDIKYCFPRDIWIINEMWSIPASITVIYLSGEIWPKPINQCTGM